jgi:hypothetical protein
MDATLPPCRYAWYMTGTNPGDLAPLPVYGGSGAMPGVDLDDVAALPDLMDEGTDLDQLR